MLARFTLSAVAALLWSGVAGAAIFVTGAVQDVSSSPPASVVNTDPGTQQDGVIELFLEQTGTVLGAPVTVDMKTYYTTYDPPISGRSLGLVGPTTVNSYYLHYDPATGGAVDGTVTFDEPILGVICEGDPTGGTQNTDPPGDTLSPTNFLGYPLTAYPSVADGNLQGIEDAPDRVRLCENTLKVHFGAGDPGDRIRILTAATGTPSLCGNGALDGSEGCDDGTRDTLGDGCFGCDPETCFACSGAPSVCTPIVTCTNDDDCCAAGCTAITDNDCPSACSADKVKCIVTKKSCVLKCYQSAAGAGTPVDPLCIAKCSTKFDTCFTKAELKGDCHTIGDAAAMEAKVDAFALDVNTELDPAPPNDFSLCRRAKLKCVDQYDRCVLTTLRKPFATTNPVNNGKLAKCQTKLDGGKNPLKGCFARAEAKLPSCETTGDQPAMQSKDDAFISDVVCELGKCHLY